MDKEFGNMDTRLGTMDTRLGNMETRLGNMETKLCEEIKSIGTKFSSELKEINEKIFNMHGVCFESSSLSASEATNL